MQIIEVLHIWLALILKKKPWYKNKLLSIK